MKATIYSPKGKIEVAGTKEEIIEMIDKLMEVKLTFTTSPYEPIKVPLEDDNQYEFNWGPNTGTPVPQYGGYTFPEDYYTT